MNIIQYTVVKKLNTSAFQFKFLNLINTKVTNFLKEFDKNYYEIKTIIRKYGLREQEEKNRYYSFKRPFKSM